MLNRLLPFEADTWAFFLSSLLLTMGGAVLLYLIMFYVLRSIFRKFERDIALVTLNVSTYPALTVFVLATLRLTFHQLPSVILIDDFENILAASLIIASSYWLVQLFIQVFIYYLKDYTRQSEAMWDDVLLPLLEAVVPVVIFVIASVFVLRSLGVDLTGIWVALGGATFILGFASQGILSNFFSGVVLLIDTPFQFGDVLQMENGSIAMLRRIGVRVTQLYLPNQNCYIYIPNSKLQEQNIVNLSRPSAYYLYSTEIPIPFVYNARAVKQVIEEAILAHPDTLGDIKQKLELIERYYQQEELKGQWKIGSLRLQAEQNVNDKLEEIVPALEALAVTLQFAEKGGLTQDEIENVQQEYQGVLAAIGLDVSTEIQANRSIITLQETRIKDHLIALTREWYRLWIRDSNLVDNDSYMISDEWERKINLLKRRTQRLYQKISNPQQEETRLDDYVMELKQWLQERFKQSRQKGQEPQVFVKGIEHDEGNCYIKFQLNFFVDDVKLENGKRGERVSSQIYQEVVQYLQQHQAASDDALSP